VYEALSSSPKGNRKLAAAYFCTSKASTFVAVKQVKYLLVGGVLPSEMAPSKTLMDLFELVVPQPTGGPKKKWSKVYEIQLRYLSLSLSLSSVFICKGN
jgi:hypothetical protein